MALFGLSPEQLRQQARTDFINQKRQALASLPNMGGGGLAGRLAQLGQAAGMALGGIGTKPDLDTEEIRIAEKRKKMLSDLFAGGKTPTMDTLLSGMGTMIKEGDYQGATGMMQLATQVGTLEAAKAKKAKRDKPSITTHTVTRDGKDVVVKTAEDPTTGETLWQKEVGTKPPKQPTPHAAKVTDRDIASTLTQARSVYKDMDFSDEYTPESHDPLLELVAGEVNKRAESKRLKLTTANRTKLTRQVLKDARKAGVISKDTTWGFSEPIIDQAKMDTFFGIVDQKKGGGLTPEQKNRLEELRAKQ